MIFPRDLNKRIKDKQRVAGDNQVQLFFTIFILANIFGFFILDWVNDAFLSGDLWLTLTLMAILDVLGGVFVFRFFIFDETAKIRELQGIEGDSFAKYMKVRKDVEHSIVTQKGAISVTEFNNGSMAFTIQMKFGSNDDFLAERTKELFRSLYAIAHSYNFETRTVVSSEDFGRSEEYHKYVDAINGVKEKVLKNSLISLSEASMERHKELCNTACVYFTVKSVRGYQRADLEDVLKNYIKLFQESVTALRSIKFLTNEELLNFFIEFYGVGAIDLSTTQAMEIAKDLDESFHAVVRLYMLRDEEDKVYETNDGYVAKFFKLGERKID